MKKQNLREKLNKKIELQYVMKQAHALCKQWGEQYGNYSLRLKFALKLTWELVKKVGISTLLKRSKFFNNAPAPVAVAVEPVADLVYSNTATRFTERIEEKKYKFINKVKSLLNK